MKPGPRLQESWASLSRITRLLLLLALLLAVSSSFNSLRLSELEPQSGLQMGIAANLENRDAAAP